MQFYVEVEAIYGHESLFNDDPIRKREFGPERLDKHSGEQTDNLIY